MPTILIDANIEGHGVVVERRLNSADWREFTTSMGVSFITFASIGLDHDSPDDIVWRICQVGQYYLLTGNRNAEGDDSLETTIRREGTIHSVPVLTMPSADRVFDSPAYLERVARKLLDYLMFAERYRGSGRLYLP